MAVTVNAAVYGVGVYGVARYGKVIVSGLDQAVGTGAVSAVQVNTAAGITGVGAITGTIEPVSAGGFEIDITERIDTGVVGTAFANTVQVNIAEVLGSVSASGSIGTVAISNTVTLSGVVGTGAVNTVEDKPTEVLGSVSATGSVNTVQANTAAGVTGVSATGSINDQLAFSNSFAISGVSAQGIVNTVEDIPTEILTGVSAEGFINTVTTHLVIPLSGVVGTGSSGQTTETAVVFDFEAVKNLYSKRRTVIIPRAA